MSERYRRSVRVAAVLLLALAALVAVGSASARDPREPKQRHTAADMAWARSVALVRGDLTAGWKVAPKEKPSPPCSTIPDESALVQTAQIDPTFVWRDGVTTIGSEVDVFKTPAMAKRDWRLSTLALMRRCLLEGARDSVQKGITVALVSATSLETPRLGERHLHYRIVFELRSRTAKAVPIVSEMIGFGVGRTSVVLHAFYSPRVPVPTAELNGLAAKLAKRLVGASGGI